MKKELLGDVRNALNELESASPYDRREIETSMEDLASQIYLLMEKKGEEPDSLADALRMLPIEKEARRKLVGIYEEIQELMDLADYEGREDPEDMIEELKNDLYSVLDSELDKIENFNA
jgi:pantothenate synthetase